MIVFISDYQPKDSIDVPKDLKPSKKSLTKTRKVGRPSEYYPERCVELLALMKNGAKDSEIYAKWGISKVTFYEWLRTHEDLKKSHEIGLELCEAKWEELGKQGMLKESDIDFKFWIAFMNRKFGWHRDSSTTGTQNNTQINIGNINVLEGHSKDELIEYIQNQLKNIPEIECEVINEKEEEQEAY